MKTQTSLVSRQCRLKEWAEMIRDCQNRPIGMSVGEWCEDHSITKANYYYRMTEVRKACLEKAAIQMPEQSIVPITDTLLTKVQEPKAVSTESTIDIGLKGIRITVNEHTSMELLERVIKVISHAQ